MEQLLIYLIATLLGGSVSAVVVSNYYERRRERNRRRIEFLQNQMNKLYGPLFYLVSTCETKLKLARDFIGAGKNYHDEIKAERMTPEREEQEKEIINKVFKISNKYTEIEEEKFKMVEILKENFHLVDPEDVETFSGFNRAYIRYKTEIDDEGLTETPLEIYRRLEDISFLPVTFIEKVKEKFFSKKEELYALYVK